MISEEISLGQDSIIENNQPISATFPTAREVYANNYMKEVIVNPLSELKPSETVFAFLPVDSRHIDVSVLEKTGGLLKYSMKGISANYYKPHDGDNLNYRLSQSGLSGNFVYFVNNNSLVPVRLISPNNPENLKTQMKIMSSTPFYSAQYGTIFRENGQKVIVLVATCGNKMYYIEK